MLPVVFHIFWIFLCQLRWKKENFGYSLLPHICILFPVIADIMERRNRAMWARLGMLEEYRNKFKTVSFVFSQTIHHSISVASSLQSCHRGLVALFIHQVLCESSFLFVRLQRSLVDSLALRTVLHRFETLLVEHVLLLSPLSFFPTLQRRQIFVVSNWNG